MAQNLSVVDVLVETLNKSDSISVEFTVDNFIPGINEDMYNWWGMNINDAKYYLLWHPDHVSTGWEVSPEEGHPIANSVERIAPYSACVMRMTPGVPENITMPHSYKNVTMGTHLAPDGRHLSYTVNEFEETENGVKIRQTFRFPSASSPELLEAIKRHVIEEAENLTKILPDLYKKAHGD